MLDLSDGPLLAWSCELHLHSCYLYQPQHPTYFTCCRMCGMPSHAYSYVVPWASSPLATSIVATGGPAAS